MAIVLPLLALAWPTVSAYVRQLLVDCRTECQTRFLSLQKHWWCVSDSVGGVIGGRLNLIPFYVLINFF